MVGGAVRNALLGEPVGDIDIATTALPEEVIRRAAAAGFKPVPTGIEHGTITVVVDGQAVRGDDLARGRRDLRPPRPGRVRARLAARRRAARLHHQRALSPRATAPSTIMSAGSPISRSGACASSAIRRGASPRTICASCASSASTPPTATADRPTPAGLPPASPARAGLETLSRERVRMEMLKLLLARACGAGAGGMARGGTAGDGAGRRAAARELRQHDQAGSASWRWRPIRCGGWARSRVQRHRGCRAVARAAAARQCRARAARVDGGCAGGGSPRRPASPKRACCSTGSGRERFLDRVLLAWSRAWSEGVARRPLARARDLAAALERAGVSAQGRRLHRPRRAERAGARRRVARGRGSVDRGGISDRSGGAGADCRRGDCRSGLTCCARPIVGEGRDRCQAPRP